MFVPAVRNVLREGLWMVV
uniref:Uncharacterized protein n=1 Tax=Anguilla anguilla TaxID=7936 RepID=A0A0E9TAZ7_ANGAN